MIANLGVPLGIDRARALAMAAASRARGRRWLAFGVVALIAGVATVTAGTISAIAAGQGGIALIAFFAGLGPIVGGVFLVRGALPSRWRAQALDFAVLVADARGAVATSGFAPFVLQPPEEVAALLAEVATEQRLGWSPPPPFGVCDVRRYVDFRSARLRRAWWFGAFAFPFLLAAGILWVLAFVALIQLEIVICAVMLLAGFGPGLPGIALGWRAVQSLRDRSRVGRLAIALLAPSIATMDDICSRARMKPADARALARAALEHGVFAPDLGNKLGLIQVQAPLASLVPSIAPSAPAQAWPGRLLKGMWLVETPLGAGGMGTVYRGRDVSTGLAVAIKVVSPDVRVDDDAFRRFHREAYALATLRHPAIVALRDYDRTDDGILFLVMDLLEGETLETLLQRMGRLPLADALSIARQIGGALSSAHGAALLHRDVKPSNIFVSGSPGAPRATLIDFGLVKSVLPGGQSRVTTRGQVVGTPLYMSPEQARGDAVDARSDLYSLAVVTYEMVTGVPPFFDPSVAVVYAKLLSGKVPSIKHVSGTFPRGAAPAGALEDRLDATLQRALSALVTDRHPTVDAFTTELAWLADESGFRALA